MGGCRGPRGRGLSLETRHFCHFSGCCVRAGGQCWCWELLSGCWGGLSEPWCWGAAGELAGALYFSEPVTFVTFGAAGLLGSWRALYFITFWCCWGLLGGCWGAGAARELAGAFCFSQPVTFVTFGAGGLLGSWRGPFISQSPSLLSLLVVGGWELLDSWKVLCFSEPVTFVTFGAAGGCWGTCFCHFWGLLGCWGAGGPLFLRTRHFCHFWCWGEVAGELGPCFSEPVAFVTSGCCQLGLVADRAPLHAPQGEVTKVTTFLKQGCCRKEQISGCWSNFTTSLEGGKSGGVLALSTTVGSDKSDNFLGAEVLPPTACTVKPREVNIFFRAWGACSFTARPGGESEVSPALAWHSGPASHHGTGETVQGHAATCNSAPRRSWLPLQRHAAEAWGSCDIRH